MAQLDLLYLAMDNQISAQTTGLVSPTSRIRDEDQKHTVRQRRGTHQSHRACKRSLPVAQSPMSAPMSDRNIDLKSNVVY
jgi:hypothetical protein